MAFAGGDGGEARAQPPQAASPEQAEVAAGADQGPGEAQAGVEAAGALATEDARERLRESLALLGFDADFFAGFRDQEPISAEEQIKLAKLLHGLPRIAAATMLEAAIRQARFEPSSIEAETDRGRSYDLRARVLRVTREAVPAELRETLGYDSYFRCEAETVGERLVIVAREVPRAWKLDTPIEQQASAIALFLKELPDREVSERGEQVEKERVLLFAAERVAWKPPTLLAYLGVDYGLFDKVTDRTPLNEREIFYAMLAAARNMAPEYLEHQIRGLVKRQLERQQRLAGNRDLPAEQRAAAERALERARAGASDVVPLFNQPASQRGEFVVLRGEALRAIEIRVEDPQIRQQFHIDRYFEVDVVTPDSQNNPIVCCLAELPAEMPLGEAIHESVQVAGFFLKGYAFATRRTEAQAGGSRQLQVAPLIVGKTLAVLPSPQFRTPTQSLTLAAGVAVVLAVCGAFMWHMRRADRRALAQLKLRRELLPAEISLANPPDAGTGESSDKS